MQDRHKRFCEEYIIDLNGRQAAIRAEFNPRSAAVTATRLLKLPEVRARIDELIKERTLRTQVTADEVIAGLREVRDRCMQKKPVMKWDREEKCMRQDTDEEGNEVWTFDSTGANRSLELLGKHVGMFVEKVDHTSAGKPITFVEIAPVKRAENE